MIRGVKVGKTSRSRRDQKLENRSSNSVTMSKGTPRSTDGKVGDITVREVSGAGLICYIKTYSGWYEINSLKSPQRVEWIPMRLTGAWVTKTSFGEPQYFRDSNGFVHLKGGVQDGGVGNAITTLPEGYRPAVEQRRLVSPVANANLIIAQMRITTGGEIDVPFASTINLDDSVDNYTTDEWSLDGISFFAGQKLTGMGGGSSLSGGNINRGLVT